MAATEVTEHAWKAEFRDVMNYATERACVLGREVEVMAAPPMRSYQVSGCSESVGSERGDGLNHSRGMKTL
jgi:hypothetical protein